MATECPLKQRLGRLSRAYDLEGLANAACGPAEISRYYRVSRYAYSRYSRGSNAVHLGLSDGDAFDVNDLAAQAEIIRTLIPAGARRIVELATGRGYNAIRLARQHPGIEVLGLDLSPAQLAYAHRDGRDLANFHAAEGDFHDLSRFEPGTVDLVFVVEALCHSADPARVIAEVARVLRPGGLFVVFDGYGETAGASADVRRAVRLLARGMAVPDFTPYREFADLLAQTPFQSVCEQDLSERTMPTLDRLSRKAEWFLENPLRRRLMRTLLPGPLVANAVSGYLFPVLTRMGAFRYCKTVATRLPH